MSRIAVVTPLPVSGAEGGNERLWRSLTAALVDHGHDAELIGIVSPEGDLAEVLASYRRFLDLDLDEFDLVISGKYPAWMVRHRRHLRYLLHPLRGLYEHYPAAAGRDLPAAWGEAIRAAEGDPAALIDTAEQLLAEQPDHPATAFPGPLARSVVQALDRAARTTFVAEAALSETVAQRPDYCDPDRPVQIIFPLGDLEPTVAADRRATPASDRPPTFLAFGRLDAPKRFDLAIRAFAAARRLPGFPADAVLDIAGTGPAEERLAALAADVPGISLLGRIDDDDLRHRLRTATATVLTPLDEDFGLVAAESMASGTPVITTTDSGGVREQIDDGVDGLVTHPHPLALARAIHRLARDAALADRMGAAAVDAVAGRSWQPALDLVDDVLAHGADDRPTVVILTTQRAEHPTNGGRQRTRLLARGLVAAGWRVRILALANDVDPYGPIRRRRTDDGVEHHAVPRSAAHLRADFRMTSVVGTPVDDVGCTELFASSPAFVDELRRQLDGAQAVVLSHPWLVHALDTADPDRTVPTLYDAHNVERDLVDHLHGDRPGADWLHRRTTRAEATALDRATAVTATSSADLDSLAGGDQAAAVVPNPVAPELVAARADTERRTARARVLADHGLDDDDRPIALFVGSNHPPNRAAVAVLADLADRLPDVRVVVAGAVEAPRTGRLDVLGPFPGRSHRRILAMADVFLCPLVGGSGTSLKVADALAVGLPVLATADGARGFADDVPGLVRVGDSLDDLVEATRSVLAVLSMRSDDRDRAARTRSAAVADHLPERAAVDLDRLLRSITT